MINIKKVIIGLFIVSMLFLLNNNEDDIIIPDNAIRFRVIANSNSLKDQSEKLVIKEKIENEIYELIDGDSDVDIVRNTIQENLDIIDSIVADYGIDYNISYGINYFPSKSYKGVLYPAGNYESLVITLGEGLGDNFWCVLFPPLCLVDTNTEIDDVEYKFFIKEILDKF